jgi:nucleoid DNA-binding protein
MSDQEKVMESAAIK